MRVLHRMKTGVHATLVSLLGDLSVATTSSSAIHGYLPLNEKSEDIISLNEVTPIQIHGSRTRNVFQQHFSSLS